MKPVLPGAAIGVLGSGQLGRMLALEARRMGYRIHTFSPDKDSPTGQVADVEVTASFDDLDAARAFASSVAVVTFEFENVPSATADAIEALVPVRPAGAVLHSTQHRLREKHFLQNRGIPIAPFRLVESETQLHAALQHIGYPAVLKTAGLGYDGKGQAAIRTPQQANDAWTRLGGAQAVLEAFVDYQCEFSVIAARGLDGEVRLFDAIENHHANHILDVSVSPAHIPEVVRKQASEIARAVVVALDAVGVICLEFFLTRDWRVLVNEIAPRTHNSGHLTIEACTTSQFEQQLRAICGLPLGATDQLRPAAMANLLGDVWNGGEPNWTAALAEPAIHLHHYGKRDPRRGRKMGHLTALADTSEGAAQIVRQVRTQLTR